ncbi:MAG: flagellar protein FliS [Lachnospiraceae bacterium]|nr:flagellar protein FliS [Lachnospiraceae bacterium]
MTNEKKTEYTRRITQANKAKLIVILYEIAIDYVREAIEYDKKGDSVAMSTSSGNAFRCVEEMQNNLHYEYDLAKVLNRQYVDMKKKLRAATVSGDTSGLEHVLGELTKLRDSYDKIADTDTSGPVMIHTQTVLTGMTYSKDRILDDLTTDCTRRGFRV